MQSAEWLALEASVHNYNIFSKSYLDTDSFMFMYVKETVLLEGLQTQRRQEGGGGKEKWYSYDLIAIKAQNWKLGGLGDESRSGRKRVAEYDQNILY